MEEEEIQVSEDEIRKEMIKEWCGKVDERNKESSSNTNKDN